MKKIINKYVLLLFFITLMFLPINVSAHTDNSEGYSKFTMDQDTLHAELSLDYFELARLIDLGINPGASANQLHSALENHHDAITTYLDSHFEILTDGAKAEGSITSLEVERRLNRDYAKITLAYPSPSTPSAIEIQYNIFFDDNDPMHRNIATYDLEKKGQFVFQSGERVLQTGNQTTIGQTTRFVQLGFHHILIGMDHILFVIGLVLGARRFNDVLKVITVFTIAHSISLGLTALNLINFPSQIIEPLIALSIAYVAVENYFGFSSKFRFAIVFAFGLIHGVGFAGALQLSEDITWRSLLSLLSFNVGVEVGQALIIMLLFPLLLYIRRFKLSTVVQGVATAGIFSMGIIWYFERFLS